MGGATKGCLIGAWIFFTVVVAIILGGIMFALGG